MESKTYYDILGVKRDCTIDDIKYAYRKLIQVLHPDKQHQHNKSNTDVDIKLINKIYETLKNPTKRAQYDGTLKPKSKVCNDFDRMKNDSRLFLDSVSATPETAANAKKMFEQFSRERDSHMRIKTLNHDIPTNLETDVTNLEFLRENEYIENTPDQMIKQHDGESNNDFTKRFNEMFVNTVKLAPQQNNEIIKHTGVQPNMAKCDSASQIQDGVFDDDDNECLNQLLSNFIITSETNDIDLNKSMDERLAERERETTILGKMRRHANIIPDNEAIISQTTLQNM